MRVHRHLSGAAFLLGLVGAAEPTATAQQGLPPIWVRISNRGGPALKVCAHDPARGKDGAPLHCWSLQAGKSAVWVRGQETSTFDIRVFRPELSTPLCERTKIANVYEVSVLAFVDAKANTTCTIKPWNPGWTSYEVKVCNETVKDTVNFVLGYAVDDGDETLVVVEGWWKLKYRGCEYVGMRERMTKWRNNSRHLFYEVKPRFFIYAQTTGLLGGAIKQVMEADEDDENAISVCIRKDANFEYRHSLTTERQCFGSKHERARMYMIPLSEDIHKGRQYWTF
jgi:hypothetical protein